MSDDQIIKILVPQAGESVQEAMIGSWLVEDNQFVTQDTPIVELETDKASMELVAEASGTLKIIEKDGAEVTVGQQIAYINKKNTQTTQDTSSDLSAKVSSDSDDKKHINHSQPPQTNQGQKTLKSSQDVFKFNPDLDYHGPAVKKLLMDQDLSLDIWQKPGSGKDYRLTKHDVLLRLKVLESVAVKTQESKESVSENLADLDEKLLFHRSTSSSKMSLIRRRIAQRLVQVKQTTAMLTTFNEVDMSAIMDIRSKYKEDVQEKHKVKLGFMGFFILASVKALKDFPMINSYIQDDSIISHNYCDVSVAVSTQRGLVVPVIKDCQSLSILQIEKKLAKLAALARDKKLSVDQMQGGTFTITNGGVFGSLLSTPIINPPQSAILGMHKIQLRPMVVDKDQIKPRPMMYLALSYDHRIVDGKEAVQFLVSIKKSLEHPVSMLLDL